MKATIEDCQDAFKIGYEAFEESREESALIWDLYHNRHYTVDQLNVLRTRGQPEETFNVVKLFARMLVGYYSTVVNTAVVRARNPRDVTTATVLNDTINYVFEENRFDILGDQIKLGGLVSGLLCCAEHVRDTGERDQFNRPINAIDLSHVPDYEIVLDPNSEEDDYSDAEYLHRFKWLGESDVIKLYGREAMNKMTAYYNHTEQPDAEFDVRTLGAGTSNSYFTGKYRVHDNYLVVHTVIIDEDQRRWSIHWHDRIMLSKTEITHREVKWPYRVQKLHSSNRTEHYGIFREIAQTQLAINQALIQIQLMANSAKVFVQEDSVEDLEEFTVKVNRVNAVIPVTKLAGIKVEEMSREIMDQYTIIDKSLDRIQRVLGVNDSFLGMAYASDSGRKVKLQQSATIMSLRYVTARIETFYRSLAMDIGNLAKQYFRAHQYLAITDAMTGERWIEINKPISAPTGQPGPDGQPMMEPILLEVVDPETQEFLEDEDGNLIYAPVPESGTDFEFTPFNIKVESSSYNDEDEKGQLLLESVMSGQIGSMLGSVNPSGFFQMASLALKTSGTKYSPQMSEILEQTAQMLSQSPGAEQQASMTAQGSSGGSPMSQALKLPQNTNEV